MERNGNGVHSMEKLTRWVRYFLFAQIVVAGIAFASDYMEYRLISNLEAGGYASQEQAVTDTQANDRRQRFVSATYMAVFIVSGILILRWIYRANRTARQLGVQGMTFTPGWSVGWYFVPIAALWKPFQAMMEIWRASYFPSDWKTRDASGLLPLWWFLWLVHSIAGRVAFRLSMDAKGIDEFMHANVVSQVVDVTAILLALVTLSLVTGIYQAQLRHARTNVACEADHPTG
jgi:hypothetical protein